MAEKVFGPGASACPHEQSAKKIDDAWIPGCLSVFRDWLLLGVLPVLVKGGHASQ
jgi:hypothetical protein